MPYDERTPPRSVNRSVYFRLFLHEIFSYTGPPFVRIGTLPAPPANGRRTNFHRGRRRMPCSTKISTGSARSYWLNGSDRGDTGRADSDWEGVATTAAAAAAATTATVAPAPAGSTLRVVARAAGGARSSRAAAAVLSRM